MNSSIRNQLTEYYFGQGIHPEKFKCRNQVLCRKYALEGKMTEAKMSLVGSRYGDNYPSILVLSLDPPKGNEGEFVNPDQRTTEYVTAIHEDNDYKFDRRNTHWLMTHIIVRELLCLFGYKAKVGTAIIDSYADLEIENVTAYFAHVNVAKCSMNDPDKYQANKKVHEKCSGAFLMQEFAILQPEILITQGKTTNEIMGVFLIDQIVSESDLPKAMGLDLWGKHILWLPMRHPTRQVAKIRMDWPYYVQAVKKWAPTR